MGWVVLYTEIRAVDEPTDKPGRRAIFNIFNAATTSHYQRTPT